MAVFGDLIKPRPDEFVEIECSDAFNFDKVAGKGFLEVPLDSIRRECNFISSG